MSKKIIQLSTKQCAPCQFLRREIEKVIVNTPYEYEYISLYNGPDINEEEFDIDVYWSEVNNNLMKYTKELGVKIFTFPTVLIQEGDDLQLISKTDIIKFLQREQNESK